MTASSINDNALDLSPERVPDHLRAIGEGVYEELCRRFMFTLVVGLMVNHDLGSGSFCYNIIVTRHGVSPLRINFAGNKLSIALEAAGIEAYYIDKGKRVFATLDYSDPRLIDSITKTIERFFECHAHQSIG